RDIEVRLHAVVIDERHSPPGGTVAVIVLVRISECQGDRVADLTVDDKRTYRSIVGVVVQPALIVLVDTHQSHGPATGIAQWRGDIRCQTPVIPAPHGERSVHRTLVTRALANIVHGARGISEPGDEPVGTANDLHLLINGG